MSNKNRILNLYRLLPERFQNNRFIIRIVTPIAENIRREQMHQLVKLRWQQIQLENELKEIREHKQY